LDGISRQIKEIEEEKKNMINLNEIEKTKLKQNYEIRMNEKESRLN